MLVGSLFVLGFFHVATIRDGQSWLDDYASYITHATNTVDAQPYDQTNYIYNPDNPFAGPRSYPPGFPLLLAPVIAVFGASFFAMKVEMVLFTVAWLGLSAVWLRKRYGDAVALGVVGLLGISPFISQLKDSILSDIPAAMFLMGALALARSDDMRARRGLLIGLCVYASIAVRPIGVALIPALIVAELVRHRRITRRIALATVVPIAGLLIQMTIVSSSGDYRDVFRFTTLRLTAANAWRYLTSLEGLTVNGRFEVVGKMLWVALAVLITIGFLRRLRPDRLDAADVLVPIYLITIATWPSFQSLRFLVPILPILLGYAATAFTNRRAMAAIGFALFLSSLGTYAAIGFEPIPEGLDTASAREAMDFIGSSVPADSVLLFARPKALALRTARTTVGTPLDAADASTLLKRFDVDVIVEGPVNREITRAIVASKKKELTKVFDNGDFVLWQLDPPAETGTAGA